MLALGFSDITTSGAIGVILIVFVAFGFIKGLVRTAFTLVALTAGILAGLWGFLKGSYLISDPDPWMSAAVGILLGLAIFFVARALFGVLLSPVGAKDGKANKLAIPGSLLGFLMGCAFVWFCLSGVRYIGTLEELVWLRDAIADETKIEKIDQPFFSKLKRGLDASGPGQFHEKFEKFDLLNDRARANLA
ncbi:MAG: CvpA family protein, partial [Akkermansiaceae bacterium]